MAQKKLQVDSEFNELDLDHDGIVSDNEMKAAELQHDLRTTAHGNGQPGWHGTVYGCNVLCRYRARQCAL